MTTNKHQRKMHSRTGATSMGGGNGRASIPVAHDELQDWPALRGTVLHDLLTTGRRFGVGRFFTVSQIARRPLNGLSDRRPSGESFNLPAHSRSVATLSRRLIGSRLQFHRIGYQPGSYVSDPFEAHSSVAFPESRSDDREPSERITPNVRELVGEDRNG